MPDSNRLTILTFPQRWTDARPTATIRTRFLVLPQSHPLHPLDTGQPAFADARIRLQVHVLPDSSILPRSGAGVITSSLDLPPTLRKRELFDGIQAANPDLAEATSPGVPTHIQVKKFLPLSYRSAFDYRAPRAPFLVTDDAYFCAFEKAQFHVLAREERTRLEWGRLLAMCLRRMPLAETLGLLYEADVPVSPAGLLTDGGWLWSSLESSSDYAFAPAGFVRSYAARLPKLASEAGRQIMAPVLFPVDSAPRAGAYDEIIEEAIGYSDGFAKVVHAFQSGKLNPVKDDPADASLPTDAGVLLGWDDEQIGIWMDRQTRVPAGESQPLAMMGIGSYCIDVAPLDSETWTSLHRVRGPMQFGAIDLGVFAGEQGVQPTPNRLDSSTSEYWLPAYFARWTGDAIGAVSEFDARMRGIDPSLLGPVRPESDEPFPLRYAHEYRFRVRAVDLAGGGPSISDAPLPPGPAPVARFRFRRVIPPRPPRIEAVSDSTSAATNTLLLHRPPIGYPEALFTDMAGAREQLLADLPAAQSEQRPPHLPDPDVNAVEVTVKVRGLRFDTYAAIQNQPYATLDQTIRRFSDDPAAPLELRLEFVDVNTIDGFNSAGEPGVLRVPSARDVRVEFRCVSDKGLDYFGTDESRFSAVSSIELRRESSSETALFLPETPSRPSLRAFFLRPDDTPSHVAAELIAGGKVGSLPATVLKRLAQSLHLPNRDMTLVSPEGRRIVFGCSAALRSTLAPDNGSVTFLSQDELAQRWIMVVRATLNRDWTWDGVESIAVTRNGIAIGAVELRRSVNASARTHPERQETELIFFDTIDPHSRPGVFPDVVRTEYQLHPRLRNAAASTDVVDPVRIILPVAVPPAQVPRIVSAGIAKSPYQRDGEYSRTFARERMLWLEFAGPVEDPHDQYFARVTAWSPDPMLHDLAFSSGLAEAASEQELPIDPEWVREIGPDAGDDEAGKGAMQPLIPTDSSRHFLLPLPPGTEPGSPDLFGMYTYEFRVGHAQVWSTAQGRFGVPLRLSGIQHPSPSLECVARPVAGGFEISSSFANDLDVARHDSSPRTYVWAVLYARVRQADGADWRNVMLGRKLMSPRPTAPSRLAAVVGWTDAELETKLRLLGLHPNTPLTVLAVELLPESGIFLDPLGGDLGEVRILRCSQLKPVARPC